MKNKIDNGGQSDLILKLAALYGTVIPGFNPKKKGTYHIDGIGKLTYNPDRQFRDGLYRLYSEGDTGEIRIDNSTLQITYVSVNTGKVHTHGILGSVSESSINFGNDKNGTATDLTLLVARLAQEVLSLRVALTQSKK